MNMAIFMIRLVAIGTRRIEIHRHLAPSRERWTEMQLIAVFPPFGQDSRTEDQFARFLFFADEAVPDHHDPFGSRPAVLAVAHAAPQREGMDRFGPLTGGGGQVRDRSD